ncbi:uncharacterized protein EI97DRAFT_462665 [Westerdykella ornata]|uniref:Nonsense-mediated mRNA decay factor n=1 Tax=Westerdykella ornata TaxID=318751 RepID=A0A6A6J597_WESOR|nr:uncharacterized protein EI97DRAFT_462665 [Westerdykella ornata]KAF2271615.1 hypothetical protein EI97DRAFT_462665 [Westerdykella ornata]
MASATLSKALELDALFTGPDNDVSGTELDKHLKDYRVVCQDLVLNDFETASAQSLETRLWNAHVKVNGIYRKELQGLKRTRNNNPVELRKHEKKYLAFIKDSQRFYRQYIFSLDAACCGITDLRKVAQKWGNDASTAAPSKQVPANLKDSMLLSCHESLIHLGDLSRWRETELVETNRNWGPAKGYYDLAAELYPDSGMPHNQLAVMAREDGDLFRSTYHLYRSLACKEPHPLAQRNLVSGFKKIESLWKKNEHFNIQRSGDNSTAARALITWFVRLHSKCFKGEEFSQHDEMENEVLTQLQLELKERSLDSVMQKIVLTNLAAEYHATVQMRSAEPPANIMRTYCFYLRLNVKTFFTLLLILQPELDRLSEGDDVHQNGRRTPQLSDKITAVARRVLPALRLYSTWFLRYWRVLGAEAVATMLRNVEVQELWKAYAGTLSLLASTFPAAELPSDTYMLEEDTETIGFQPLISPETKKLWYNGNEMKQKWSDLERNHPNTEMLMRVRDLLVDGLVLADLPEAPLDLNGLRFIYREADIPSELLASPNNPPDASPPMPAEAMEIPLFPQVQPVPEDQQSQSVSVVAPSETPSAALARESALTRMVDDLVSADANLEPLPEEDENIPPTPPDNTFENTVVTENGFGSTTFTISDIVNNMQKKKPTGSPAPASYLPTPMERVGSNSSARHVANLPSIPDGSYNGHSIWNQNYSGPSSPFVGNAHDLIGSPKLGGLHAPSYGHSRNNSSTSLRSIGWNGPSMSISQRQVSGGLGNGGAWGNPASPVYQSCSGAYQNGQAMNGYGITGNNGYGAGGYTNGYASRSQNYAGLEMTNPLHRKRDRSTELGQGYSSFAHASFNGQAG